MMQYIEYNPPDGVKITQSVDGVHVQKGGMEAVITRNENGGYDVAYVNRDNIWINGCVQNVSGQRFRSLMFNIFG